MAGRGKVKDGEIASDAQNRFIERAGKQTENEIVLSASRAIDLPRVRRFRVTNLQGIAREMGSVYREMRRGTLPLEAGTKLTYVLLSMSKVVEVGLLEQRIEALEKGQEA